MIGQDEIGREKPEISTRWLNYNHDEIAFEMKWNDRAAIIDTVEHFTFEEFAAWAEATSSRDYDLAGRILANAAERVIKQQSQRRIPATCI